MTEGKGPAMDQPASGPDQAGPARDGALAALRRWLANQALLGATVPTVAAGFAEGLLAAGIPLWRAHLAVSTLDPQVEIDRPDLDPFGWARTRRIQPWLLRKDLHRQPHL